MKGQFPWIGRSRGSAGGMTTAKVNDKNVMRAKAFKVTNPKTAAQVMQRDFFKEVQDVCASVTEDELRSLFGVKPKTMTRRNALSKQIAAAYTISNGVKSVDFSKLGAIGNGEKVTTPYVEFSNGTSTDETTITATMLNIDESLETNLIIVAFDSVNNKIIIVNAYATVQDGLTTAELVSSYIEDFTGFAYVTCDSKGEVVSYRGFGSFIIKTRAEKTGRDINKN